VERLENEIFNLKEKNAHLEEDVKILKSRFDSINDQFDKLASEKSTTTASIKDHISIRRMHQETMSGRLSLFKSSATEKDNSPTRQSHRNVRALPKGLKNNGVLCFNNALLQSFASLRHLTTFMNDPPKYNKEAYPLNHAFCTILNLMSSQDEGQESTLDPSSFVDLFMKKHPKFIDNESEFS
jgi:ubiquitin C-terminal hydrolase